MGSSWKIKEGGTGREARSSLARLGTREGLDVARALRAGSLLDPSWILQGLSRQGGATLDFKQRSDIASSGF